MVSLDKTPRIEESEEFELSDPLLPQYRKAPLPSHQRPQSFSASSSSTQPIALPIGKRKSGRGRSVLLTLTSICCCGLLLVLATPLVLLYKQGVLIEGLQSVLRPLPDQKSFPTNVGYAGPTPTGHEAGLLVTVPALPLQTVQPLLVVPEPASNTDHFNMMRYWGQLSPWFSTNHGLKHASSVIPKGFKLTSLHWLNRHGARYPTSSPEGPPRLAARLNEAPSEWQATGALEFLNDWEYGLGSEILTPFGREQLYNLGVSARVKYGFLLEGFVDRLPILRTESQDRMLKSAQNFAAGFFGIPAESQFNLEVTIEAVGINNTLAPYMTCRNEWRKPSIEPKLKVWRDIFLNDARDRLGALVTGLNLTVEDVNDMMTTAAYETVALGHSSFSSLFTEKEWKGFEYSLDLMWWYGSSFGSPVARAMGVGWVQELVSRLTHTRITEFDTTTNGSFHNDIQMPLNDPLYIDFTHDSVFAYLFPTLNLTNFASGGPLPLDHIPRGRKFITSQLVPFATNFQFQVLSSTSSDADYIRLILNDGVVPLTGLRGCPEDKDGLCPLNKFVGALREIISDVDFERECLNEDLDLTVETVTGSPPK